MIPSVIIVGGGVWGSASVEAFVKAGRSVVWIDDDDEDYMNSTAASADIARIIRAEYSDPAYRKLAEESLRVFQTQAPYNKYFHQTGWFLVQDDQQAQHGSIPSGTHRVSIEEFRQTVVAGHIDGDVIITKTSDVGWVEANNLQKDLKASIDVEKRPGTVTGLIFEGPFCRGVRLGAEDVLGEMVILATGWRTNRLLALHRLAQVDYDVVGVPVLGIKLSDEQYMRYKDMPILCQPGRGKFQHFVPIRGLTSNQAKSSLQHRNKLCGSTILNPSPSTLSQNPPSSSFFAFLLQGMLGLFGDVFPRSEGLSRRDF